MAREPIKITCPCCETILVIDPQEKKVIETRKPLVEESTGDRLKDAFHKVKQRQDDAQVYFEKAKENEKIRRTKFDELFRESIERVKNSDKDGTPPVNNMDL